MDATKQPDERRSEPHLKRPDEAVKDLEPDTHDADAVKGGSGQLKVGFTPVPIP